MSDRAASRFTWLGHATVRIDLPDGCVVVIDPWLTGNPSAPPNYSFDRLDLILVSHAHSDHMTDAMPLAKRHDALIIGTYDLCAWFAKQGVARTSGMNVGGTQEACGCKITQVRADHSSGFDDDEGRPVYGGVATGFVIELSGGFTLYHAGDTALYSDMSMIADLWKPELAFLPIGGHFTMDPDQAGRACRLLGVRRAIPIHWGTFPILAGTPAAFEAALRRHGAATELVSLAPGESWSTPD